MGRYEFEARLWRHSGEAAWFFVTLPEDLSDEIEATTEHRGFGSVRVEVTVGATTWRTSLFPDTKAGAYVLPVKKPVRTVERLGEGEPVPVTVEVLDPMV